MAAYSHVEKKEHPVFSWFHISGHSDIYEYIWSLSEYNLRWKTWEIIPHDIIYWTKTNLNCRSSVYKKSTQTAFIGIKSINICHLLLIRCIWLHNWSSVSVSTSIRAVCWSGAIRCVLTQWQEGKTPAIILEKYLLLPIYLRRVIRQFPDNLESIILQRERLFTNGKHYKTVDNCKKKKKRKRLHLHLRLYGPQLAC